MKFPIVYLDPPWAYSSRCPWSETRFGGGAVGQYDVSWLEEMASWAPQFEAMRPDSGVMLMWVTGPWLEDAFKLMRAYMYTPIKPVFY